MSKTACGFFQFLTLWVLCANGAPAAAPRLGQTQINGTAYVSLASWAKVNGLSSLWMRRDESIRLTNRTARVDFEVSSREASVNGVELWLLYPLVNRSGKVYISRLDADTTLKPVLFPPRNKPGDKVRTICIDPGHGGKDPGNMLGSKREKVYTMLLAFELRDQLRKAGFNVVMTRSTDKFVELPDRPAMANRSGADLFVSLHFNATAVGRGTVRGIEVYSLTPAGARSTAAAGRGETAGSVAGNRFNEENLLLAWQIQRSLTRRLATDDRGVRRARFWVLRDAAIPAVLVEGGFMSHPLEGKRIFDETYRRRMAQAIADGIVAYKKTVERAR